jgi:hypothetical protein
MRSACQLSFLWRKRRGVWRSLPTLQEAVRRLYWLMPDEDERLATTIMNCAGTHANGSFNLLVFELRKLGIKPDLHQRVALEVIAAAGLNAAGSFDLLVEQLRTRYPMEDDLEEFIIRTKRRVSLKTGRHVPHEQTVRK